MATIETGSRDTIEADPEGAYPFVVRSPVLERIATFGYDTEAVLTAGDGDVGKIFHHLKGRFDAHQRVYVMRNFRGVTGRWLYYFMSCNFKNVTQAGTAKSTVDSLRRPMLASFVVLRPPLDDQRAICRYLDRETARLDELIAEQKLLIQSLAERRQAVVTHRLSRPGAATVPLKRVAVSQTGLTLGNEAEDGEEVPYLRVANVQTGFFSLDLVKTVRASASQISRHRLRSGDVLMTEGGDLDKLGRGAVWQGQIDPCLHQNHVFAVRCGDDLDADYLTYWMDSLPARQYFRDSAKKTTNLAAINSTILGMLPVALPARAEQQRVIADLDKQTGDIDELDAECRGLINLLKERRAALITAAVTGQIDVPESA